jgi:hypothetical protein
MCQHTTRQEPAPEAPHLRDRLYKLLAMLAGGRRLTYGERFDFQAFVALEALVAVRTCVRDCDGDKQPPYSHDRKILALKPPTPLSTTWMLKGVGGSGLRVSGEGSAVLAAGNGVELPDGSLIHPQPDGGGCDAAPSGSTPSRRALEAFFGRGADLGQRAVPQLRIDALRTAGRIGALRRV